MRWQGFLPNGLPGAPVFVAEHRGGREFALRCIGLIAGRDQNPPVATFDTIRTLINYLVASADTPRLRDRLTGLLRRNER